MSSPILSLMVLTILSIAPSFAMMLWIKSLYPFPVSYRFFGVSLVAGVMVALPVMFLVMPVRTFMYGFDDPGWAVFYRAFVSASLLEETMKLVGVLILLWSMNLKKSPTLLILVGALVSLGFATFENILYVTEEGASTALIRAVTAIPCHGALGTIMGYYLAKAQLDKLNGCSGMSASLKAWIVPVLLHGLYDFPLMAGVSPTFKGSGGASVGLAFLCLLFLVLWTRMILHDLKARA